MSNPNLILVTTLFIVATVGGMLLMVYQRWYLPHRARQRAERLRREEDAGVPPSPRDYHFAVSFDAEGFTIRDLRSRSHAPKSMRWVELHRATAFKRDLWSVDCICLFFARPDETGLEIDEEMAGWRRLVAALPLYLPGCRPWDDWFSAVAFPAFVPNPTEIYCRAKSNVSVADPCVG